MTTRNVTILNRAGIHARPASLIVQTAQQFDSSIWIEKEDVKINASVDETLIGGLIVKVGSKMIDTSVKAKLNALQNTMKEAR